MSATRQPNLAPITVVLLNFNGGKLLEQCAQSLRSQRVFPERIVLVDNGSAAFDEKALRSLFGERPSFALDVLRLERNQGYVGGMNHGLRHALSSSAASEWLMTLSNDTVLDENFFFSMRLECTMLTNKVGMLAPKLRSMSDPELLDGTGLGISLDGMSTARGQREPDQRQYDLDVDVLVPNGVAAMYRAETLKEVGLLDDAFWAYCEDTDLGLRAWLAGWDCRFVPECVVYHARSSSLGEHSLNKLYLVERNHYWVAVKNLPLPLLILNPTFTFYRYLVQLFALATRQGQGEGFASQHSPRELALTTLRALGDAGAGLPRAIRQRLEQKSLRRRSSLETLQALWRKRIPFGKLILR